MTPKLNYVPEVPLYTIKHYINIRNYHQQSKAHPVKALRQEWGSEEEGGILGNNQNVCHPKLGKKERFFEHLLCTSISPRCFYP